MGNVRVRAQAAVMGICKCRAAGKLQPARRCLSGGLCVYRAAVAPTGGSEGVEHQCPFCVRVWGAFWWASLLVPGTGGLLLGAQPLGLVSVSEEAAGFPQHRCKPLVQRLSPGGGGRCFVLLRGGKAFRDPHFMPKRCASSAAATRTLSGPQQPLNDHELPAGMKCGCLTSSAALPLVWGPISMSLTSKTMCARVVVAASSWLPAGQNSSQ